MRTIEVKDIKNYIGKEVKLKGWLRNYRKASSKLRFVIFRDGTGEIQCVAFKPEMGEENFEEVKKLTLESSMEIIGRPNEHPKRKGRKSSCHLK